jgi:hypothetical protein
MGQYFGSCRIVHNTDWLDEIISQTFSAKGKHDHMISDIQAGNEGDAVSGCARMRVLLRAASAACSMEGDGLFDDGQLNDFHTCGHLRPMKKATSRQGGPNRDRSWHSMWHAEGMDIYLACRGWII